MKSIIAAALAAAALAACASGPAPAPAAAKAAPVKTAKAEPGPNDMVCRREVLTGHTLPSSVCHTRDQWTAISKANQKGVDSIEDGRRGQAPPGGNQ